MKNIKKFQQFQKLSLDLMWLMAELDLEPQDSLQLYCSKLY